MNALRIRLVAAAATVIGVSGCGGATTGATGSQPATITVLAASSLSQSFTASAGPLRTRDGINVRLSFAGSQQLVQNVIDGAPADVIATADTTTMQRLVSAGLVDAPETFAHNRLEIAVQPGNPKHITALADLAINGVTVVLAASTVPAGKYALQALHRAGVTVHPVSLELDVAAVLEKVESGDADAAIVYVTDVSGASGKVQGVPIPDQDNVIATYPIAVVRSTSARNAAETFIGAVVSGVVQQALRQHGFLPP